MRLLGGSADSIYSIAVAAGLTYHACDMPQPEMTLVPLIVVTTLVEILFFSIRLWVMRKKGHSRGYDDISISIAFVSVPRAGCWSPDLCVGIEVAKQGSYRDFSCAGFQCSVLVSSFQNTPSGTRGLSRQLYPTLAHFRSCRLLILCFLTEQYYGFYKNVWTGKIVGLDRVTIVFFAYEIIYCTAVSTTFSHPAKPYSFPQRTMRAPLFFGSRSH